MPVYHTGRSAVAELAKLGQVVMLPEGHEFSKAKPPFLKISQMKRLTPQVCGCKNT
jgi:hypothetical protein